jgi:hypothetical protein
VSATCLAALLASLAFSLSGLVPGSTGVASADVIDEYEEPPPPVPEPRPEPTPGGSDKPSPSAGSDSGSGSSYDYGSAYSAPAPTAGESSEKKDEGKANRKEIKPDSEAPAVVAVKLNPPSGDSSFLSATLGGVGWMLPGLMLLILSAAAIAKRLDRPKVETPRVPRSGQ